MVNGLPKTTTKSSNKEYFDSPLTAHGKPRKRRYPKDRKPRELERYNTERTMKFSRIKKESQLRLLTFAPMYTNIYTLAYGRSDSSKYFYIDVFAISDNRLYKITKMVAKVMGYNIIPSHHTFRAPNVMQVPNLTKNDLVWKNKGYLTLEEMVVKELSLTMFGIDNGYFHESIMALFPFEVEKTVKQKDYRVR